MTLTEAWKSYKKAEKEQCSKFSPPEAKGMKEKFVQTVLAPLGKELFQDDTKFTSIFLFHTADDVTEEDKIKYLQLWEKIWSEGKLDPVATKVSAGKKPEPKRGSALDDFDMSDLSDGEDTTVPEVVQMEEAKPTEDTGDEDWDSLPLKDKIKKNLEHPRNKPSKPSNPVSQTRAELIEQLLGASDGLTEDDVRRIATDVFNDLLNKVMSAVSKEIK